MSDASGKPIRVLVITVSYRTAPLVIESLRALADERAREAQCGIEVSAFVVDNASGDGAPIGQAIAENAWEGWATVHVAERNGGFSYGNNLGFKHGYGLPEPPDYFFLLNPDARVCPNVIGALVGFMREHPRVGTAGASQEDGKGGRRSRAFRFPTVLSEIDTALEFGLFTKLIPNHVVARTMGDQAEEVDWYPGASMMIRREVIDQLGGMDEGYFLYYEETDFCLKVQRAGWQNWYVPQARIVHLIGQSTGVTGAGATERRLPAYWFDSRHRFYRKAYGRRYATVVDAAFVLAFVAGEAKARLQGRPHGRPQMLRDFFRHAWRNYRAGPIAAPAEFSPPTATAKGSGGG